MLLSCTFKVDGEHAGSVASFTLPLSRERFLVGCGSGCSLVTEQHQTGLWYFLLMPSSPDGS